MKIKRFKDNNYCNKFNFIPGREYEYAELPTQIKKDIVIQLDDDSYESPEDFIYIAKLLKPEDTIEFLESSFGEYDITDAMEHSYMKKLVKNIQEKGLDYPPVGIEGGHRALAYYIMNKEMPYLEMKIKEDL